MAVTPANSDIATSEPLKLAKDVDPEGLFNFKLQSKFLILGNRTIAVITKLDMVDKGTDASDVLTGATLPVKLGIVGVVNRGHADKEKSLKEASELEKSFLKEHYPKIADQNGVKYLASLLSSVGFFQF